MKNSYIYSEKFQEKTRDLIEKAEAELRRASNETKGRAFSEVYTLLGWIEGTLQGIKSDTNK